MASEELIRLRDELEKEQAHLNALEEDVELTAAQLGCLHEEYIANMEKIIYFYQPQLLPRLASVAEAHEKRKLVEAEIAWLEKKVVEQEKRLRVGTFVEARDMKAYAEKAMQPVLEELQEVYEAFDECPERALITMSNYNSPPDVAIDTMRLVMHIRGEEDDSWSASQVLLTSNYFKAFFVPRSQSLLKTTDLLDENIMEELERYCEKPEHAVKELYKSSEPIGVLGQWLWAIRNFYRVRYYTAPVLLVDTTVDTTLKARAVLRRLTFGPSGQLPDRIKSSAANEKEVSEEAEDGGVVPEEKASQTQAELRELRHYLHYLDKSLQTSLQKAGEVEAVIRAELNELRESYDSTMIPIETQLEDKTSSFTTLLHLC